MNFEQMTDQQIWAIAVNPLMDNLMEASTHIDSRKAYS